MFRFQSLDEDCTLEEEDEGLIEEEDEIDQFNDDTFGAGAIDDDWQEEHKRLAELDERDGLGAGAGGGGGGMGKESHLGGTEDSSSTHPPTSTSHLPLPCSLPSLSFSSSSSGLPPSDVEDRGGEGELAESLARLILEADPAIAGVGATQRPCPSLSSSGPGLSALQGLDRPRVLPQHSSIPHPTQPHQHPHHPQHQLPPGPSTSGLPPGHHPSSMLSYQQQQHLMRSRGSAPISQMNSHSIWENSMGFGPVSVTPGLVTHMEVAKVEHTYRPVQFAGSLGKLTVSSVNNPRKMIDAVVTTRTDDEEKREKQVWNKRRQILYTVEKMYSLLLEVQDFEKRFVQAPEEDREALLEQHKTNTVQLCNSLREKEWDDRVSDEQCVMIMSVRKGKRLISRLLPFLPSPQATAIVMAIARNLPALAKKDKQDQVLCWLMEPVSAVIQSLSSSALTDLLQELQGNEGQLATVLHNKFGVTLLYLILSEGERMQSSDPNCQLMDDNRWTELVFSVTRELLSVPSSSLSPPLFTPSNLLSLFSRYVDRQRLELLQNKLQISALTR
ncbi:protein PAT1 homolog 1 [Lates japonicus]|uniref:Protein PAT1 homolog 1 n=1 Tax=Lates japonicus TaxID=270547 RepID=A0AAD3MWN8_LATJO|nr:protein PAT1 homolog 1 [Lates japonicus]